MTSSMLRVPVLLSPGLGLALLASLGAACGSVGADRDGGGGAAAQTDTGPAAQTDTGADAQTDTAADTGADAERDSPTDPQSDTAADSRVADADAGLDGADGAPPVVNLSGGRTTVFQSSQQSAESGADRAVDGKLAGTAAGFIHLGSPCTGSVNHEAKLLPQNSWWQVDLGGASYIQEIRLWDALDGSGNFRNEHLVVMVSDVPFAFEDPAVARRSPAVSSAAVPHHWWDGTEVQSTVIPVNRSARYVRVQQTAQWDGFMLAEVEVIGQGGVNVARNGAAVASMPSQYYASSGADKAVDGVLVSTTAPTSYMHTGGPCTNANLGGVPLARNPYWQIDLGEARHLEHVLIWNTAVADGGTATLDLFVSEDPFATWEHAALLSDPAVFRHEITAAWAAGDSHRITLGRPGRYLRLQQRTAHTSFNLAEVQVFGR